VFLKERFSKEKRIPSGTIVATREQTAGRGRSNRNWLSAPNTNLCFSIFIETNAELTTVPSLTMATALAVTEYLNTLRIPAIPKWPNDVLVESRKICGILSERVQSRFQSGIIVGIGLNVNMSSEEAKSIDRPATSILIESETTHDLTQTLDELIPLINYWIEKWEKSGFSAIRKIWTERAGPIGKPLTVHDGSTKKSGTLAGFGNNGELLLQTTDGLETIWSGDIS
ncbi:MAG TPA: biotin--[acetyl-CoA-carboxylase] ligase, partial [Pontiella sp.]